MSVVVRCSLATRSKPVGMDAAAISTGWPSVFFEAAAISARIEVSSFRSESL